MFYNIVFFIITFYILLRTIAYGLYEIKNKNNKVGGICVILLTIFSVIFSNFQMLP